MPGKKSGTFPLPLAPPTTPQPPSKGPALPLKLSLGSPVRSNFYTAQMLSQISASKKVEMLHDVTNKAVYGKLLSNP